MARLTPGHKDLASPGTEHKIIATKKKKTQTQTNTQQTNQTVSVNGVSQKKKCATSQA